MTPNQYSLLFSKRFWNTPDLPLRVTYDCLYEYIPSLRLWPFPEPPSPLPLPAHAPIICTPLLISPFFYSLSQPSILLLSSYPSILPLSYHPSIHLLSSHPSILLLSSHPSILLLSSYPSILQHSSHPSILLLCSHPFIFIRCSHPSILLLSSQPSILLLPFHPSILLHTLFSPLHSSALFSPLHSPALLISPLYSRTLLIRPFYSNTPIQCSYSFILLIISIPSSWALYILLNSLAFLITYLHFTLQCSFTFNTAPPFYNTLLIISITFLSQFFSVSLRKSLKWLPGKMLFLSFCVFPHFFPG